jgi:hypothetical protein
MGLFLMTSLVAMASWEVETVFDATDNDLEVSTIALVSDDDGAIGQHFFVYEVFDTGAALTARLYSRRYEQDSGSCTPAGGELYHPDCFDDPILLSDKLDDAAMVDNPHYLPSVTTSDANGHVYVSARRDPISGETACEEIPALEEIILNKTTGSISSPRYLIDQENTKVIGGASNDICELIKHSYLIGDTTQAELHACWTVEGTGDDVWCHVRPAASSNWGAGAVAVNSSSGAQDHATIAVRGSDGRAILYHDTKITQRFEDSSESIIGAEEDAGSSGANWPHIVAADGVLHATWMQTSTVSYAQCDGTNTECENWGDAGDTGGLDDRLRDVDNMPVNVDHDHPQIAVDTDGNVFIVFDMVGTGGTEDIVAVTWHCAGDDVDDWDYVVPSIAEDEYEQEIGVGTLEGWSAISLDYSETNDIRVDIVFTENGGSPNERVGKWASASVCNDDLCPGSAICP